MKEDEWVLIKKNGPTEHFLYKSSNYSGAKWMDATVKNEEDKSDKTVPHSEHEQTHD